MRRSRRPLSDEDRRLWDHVRRTADPLRPAPEEPTAERPPPPPPAAPAATPVVAVPAKPKPAPTPPLPGGLDRKTLTRLGRGSVAIDARIDLHGMTQEAAHHRLLRFLDTARKDGARIVLVITGKGAPDLPAIGAGRGVLRRAVPEWLASPAFRIHVSGYENAGRRHGGEGALYVRLRRRAAGRG
jgi:DNA-nicking Smr family endonuclease